MSLAPPQTSPLAALADPPTRYVDTAAMDYFLIEMVPTLRESAAVATARHRKLEQQMIDAGLLPNAPSSRSARESTASVVSRAATTGGVDDEEEPVRQRLESIGMHVGGSFSVRLCNDRAMFADTLDIIKFICKDIWAACWDKQIDNLRTNHRGVYVLQDNAFRPITRLSSSESRADAVRRSRLHAAMPAGIIRGVLSRVGLASTVTPEITSMPQCTFQVKLPKGS